MTAMKEITKAQMTMISGTAKYPMLINVTMIINDNVLKETTVKIETSPENEKYADALCDALGGIKSRADVIAVSRIFTACGFTVLVAEL